MSCSLKERVKSGAKIYLACFDGPSGPALEHALSAAIRPLAEVRPPHGKHHQHQATLRMPKAEAEALLAAFRAAYADAADAKAAAAAAALQQHRVDAAAAAAERAREEAAAVLPAAPRKPA